MVGGDSIKFNLKGRKIGSNFLVNLTPHELCLRINDGSDIEIPPSGNIARVKTDAIIVDYIHDVPVVEHKPLEVNGIPEPQPNVIYLVSFYTLQVLDLFEEYKRRDDILATDTGPTCIRNNKGKIVAVTRLRKN